MTTAIPSFVHKQRRTINKCTVRSKDVHLDYAEHHAKPCHEDATELLDDLMDDCGSDNDRIALVLDVDECLIHSHFGGDDGDYRQEEGRPESLKILDDCFEVFMEDGEKALVNKRPGLDEFLLKCSKEFDVYAYTAALEIYGRPILDELDPDNTIFKGRFYRDSCFFRKGCYLKDLRIIRSDLSRVILVDNNPVSFLLQPNNGIPVPSFYDNANDTTLVSLFKVLQIIKNFEDVRPKLRQMFNLAQLLREHQRAIMG